MATVLARPSTSTEAARPALSAFLNELTSLCQKHGIGLTDGATLFLMEQEDYYRVFSANEESEISFI